MIESLPVSNTFDRSERLIQDFIIAHKGSKSGY